MGLRLSVRRQAWQDSLQAQAALVPGLIPVVKGNGYGFGRATLMPLAAELADHIAVGTIFEAADVPANRSAVVLTPHLGPLPHTLAASTMLTVGSIAHVDALHAQQWSGSVVVKLQSSMRRYGVTHADLAALNHAVASAGCVVAAYALHFPLVGGDQQHVDEVEGWLADLPPELPLGVSHLDPSTYRRLIEQHGERRFHIRCGTSLWHRDKSLLYLSADVLDMHAVTEGETVGYTGATIPTNGHVVLVGAGSAHGVRSFDDGRSPFHFAHHRLQLLEPAHMHTSMLFVPSGQECPAVGERVDVQRPLTHTLVDELEWVDD
jgi:alanine racemase